MLAMLAVFCTPLAINFNDMDVRLGLSLPTEPILIAIMFLFLLKQFYNPTYDIKIIRHPVTLAIIFNLVWIALTSITSEMPIVSLKFLVSRLWFVTVFYFLFVFIFKKISLIKQFAWLYIIPLTIIIIYTLITHAQLGFDEKSANWVVSPFYNDHTAYGAALAMFIPVLIGFIFYKNYNNYIRSFAFILTLLFLIATVFSYTRAAWVSLAVAAVVMLLLYSGIKFRTMLFGGIVFGCFFFFVKTDIVMSLERNRQDASDNFIKHVQSISNISSDASNLERLNRWNCALKMFSERPWFGWGPGTYSFQYAPFQESKDKTIISTNLATGGNAHSEYLGPLSESGLLGMLSFVAIMLCVVATGFKVYYESKSKEIKLISATVLLGLITYFVHGGLNNFLDTDKLSCPFWGFSAILVAFDLYHNKNKEEESVKLAAE